MAKYVYPAVFTKYDDGYSVEFPDVPGCYSCGDTLADAMTMASDALALMLFQNEHDGKAIPEPSKINEIFTDTKSFLSYVCCDTLGYQKKYNNKAVKKTLTIPEWLNEAAVAANLNFSQILQNALKKELEID